MILKYLLDHQEKIILHIKIILNIMCFWLDIWKVVLLLWFIFDFLLTIVLLTTVLHSLCMPSDIYFKPYEILTLLMFHQFMETKLHLKHVSGSNLCGQRSMGSCLYLTGTMYLSISIILVHWGCYCKILVLGGL